MSQVSTAFHAVAFNGNYISLLIIHHPGKRDRAIREHAQLDFMCPCMKTHRIHPWEFPAKDLLMPCGDPTHFAIKYEEAPETVPVHAVIPRTT